MLIWQYLASITCYFWTMNNVEFHWKCQEKLSKTFRKEHKNYPQFVFQNYNLNRFMLAFSLEMPFPFAFFMWFDWETLICLPFRHKLSFLKINASEIVSFYPSWFAISTRKKTAHFPNKFMQLPVTVLFVLFSFWI